MKAGFVNFVDSRQTAATHLWNPAAEGRASHV